MSEFLKSVWNGFVIGSQVAALSLLGIFGFGFLLLACEYMVKMVNKLS